MLLKAGTGTRRSNGKQQQPRSLSKPRRAVEGAGLLPLWDSSFGPSHKFIHALYGGFQKAGTKKKEQELCETC